MAVVSNKCNGSLGDYCKVYLDYTINNKEEDRIARNKSNITLKLYGQATSSSVGAFNLYGTAKAYLKIDGTTKKSSTTLNMDFRNKAKVEMLTWTGDVAHNDDGSLTITISGNFDTNGPSSVTTGSVSYKWTLPKIARTSSVTCADGNIGSSTTINISRANDTFTHTLKYSFLGLSGTIATKTTSTSIGWTIPTSFYAKIPNDKSGQGTITCETFSGDTSIGTKTCTFNAMVLESINKPTITATVTDTNQSTIALTGNANKLVKYFSNAQVDITATSKNSATINSQKVVCGAKSGTSSSNVLNGVESGTFDLSCTDSRGFSATNTITKEIVEYIKLAFTDVKLSRPKTTSNTVNCSIKGNYFNSSFGQNNNTLSLKYRYRISGGQWSQYITLTPTITSNTYSYNKSLGDVFNFNNEYEYEFVIEDKLMIVTQPVTVHKGIPLIDIGQKDVTVNEQIYMGENKVLSFDATNNCLRDKEGNKYTLGQDVIDNLTSTSAILPLSANQGRILNNKINPIGTIITTATNTNPSATYGGTWTLIDKELKPSSATSGGFNRDTTNTTGSSCYWSRGGHSITFELVFTSGVDISDSTLKMGTIDLATLGISRFNNTHRLVAYSDGGNCCAMINISIEGVVTTVDVIPDAYIASGQTVNVTFTATIAHTNMADSACNKFFWQRTA